MENLEQRTNQEKLRSFLGFCNAFRRFVPIIARLAACFNKKRMNDQQNSLEPFDAEKYVALEALKDVFISWLVLALLINEGKYTLGVEVPVVFSTKTRKDLSTSWMFFRTLNVKNEFATTH